MKRYKRLVVLSDIQSPFHLPQALALAIEYIKRFKPDLLILNGDIVDFYTLSTFKKIGRGPNSLIEEIITTNNEVLDPILAACPPKCKKVWVAGNHEHRLKASIAVNVKFLENFPGLNIEECFRMKERGIRYIDSQSGNGIFWITQHLVAMHGIYTSVHAAKKYTDSLDASVIYGHCHKEQYWRDTKALGGKSKIAIGAGCLCQDPEDFNSLARYDRGFVAGWFDPDSGIFEVQHKRIAGPDNTILFSDYGPLKARKTKKGWTVDGELRDIDTLVSTPRGQRLSSR